MRKKQNLIHSLSLFSETSESFVVPYFLENLEYLRPEDKNKFTHILSWIKFYKSDLSETELLCWMDRNCSGRRSLLDKVDRIATLPSATVVLEKESYKRVLRDGGDTTNYDKVVDFFTYEFQLTSLPISKNFSCELDVYINNEKVSSLLRHTEGGSFYVIINDPKVKKKFILYGENELKIVFKKIDVV